MAEKFDDMGLNLIHEALRRQEEEKETGKPVKAKRKNLVELSAKDDIDLEQFKVPDEAEDIDLEQFKTGEPEEGGPESVQAADAALQAFIQGATFGWSDEAISRAQSLLSDKTYRELWEERQKELRSQRKAYPKLYMGGEIAGGIASSFIPGIGWVGAGGKLAQGASALGKIAQLMKYGAIGGLKQGVIQGAGQSEYEYSPDKRGMVNVLKDVVQHGAEGAVGGAVGAPIGAGVGYLASKGLGAVGALGKKAIEKSAPVTGPLLFNLRADIAKHLVKYPKIYEAVKDMKQGQHAEKMVAAINELSAETSRNKAAAVAKLSDEPTVPVADVLKDMENTFFNTFEAIKRTTRVVEKMVKEPRFLTDPITGKRLPNPNAGRVRIIKQSVPHLDSPGGSGVVNDYNEARRMIESDAVNGMISERQLANIMRRTEEYINRSAEAKQTASNNAFTVLKGQLNDKITDPQYINDMVPIASATRTLEDMRKNFALKRVVKNKARGGIDERYEATKETTGKLNQLSENIPGQRAVTAFQMYSPEDYINAAQAIKNAKAFDVRKPFIGTLLGGATGAMKGSLTTGLPIGAALGASRDLFGPAIMRGAMTATPKSIGTGGARVGGYTGSEIMTNPIWNRYYLGNIITGETDEEWRARQEREAAERALGGGQ